MKNNEERFTKATARVFIERLHKHLELMKYVNIPADHDEDGAAGRRSGQGLDIRIVTLPDLLLDFRSYNIKKKNDCAGKNTATSFDVVKALDEYNVCTVGGRAARTACALLHLLTDDDGTFRVNLVAKTGNLGRLLLQNEFQESGAESQSSANRLRSRSQHTFQTEILPYLLSRDGEPRCALMEDTGSEAKGNKNAEKSAYDRNVVATKSVDPTAHSELNDKDLHRAKEAVEKADCIFLSSIRTPAFKNILAKLLNARGGKRKYLFIDIERSAQKKDVEAFIQCIEIKEGKQDVKLGGFFVSTANLNTVKEAVGAKGAESGAVKLAREKGAPVIIYDAVKDGYAAIRHIGPGGETYELTIPDPDVDKDIMSRENTAERFKGGVLLAYALKNCLELYEENDGFYRLMREEWSGSLGMDCSLSGNDFLRAACFFAVNLAKIDTRNSKFDSVVDYYRQFDWDNGLHYIKNARIPTVALHTDTAGKISIDQTEQNADSLVSLAALRRCGKMNVLKEVPICDPRRSACNCDKNEDSHKAAIMFDLDGTLLNSTQERNRAVEMALLPFSKTTMLRDRGVIADTDELVSLFKDYVYDMHEVFAAIGDLLGLHNDFRQEWNNQGWYSVLLTLARNEAKRGKQTNVPSYKAFLGEYKNRLEKIKKSNKNTEQLQQKKDQIRQTKADLIHKFRNDIAKTEKECRDIILRIQSEFKNIRMRSFKEARDLLVSLKESEAFSLYIVSEGHYETQAHKIQAMGLDDIFEPQKILTTSDAANTAAILMRLAGEIETIRKDLEAYQSKERADLSRLSEVNDLKNELLIEHHGERLRIMNATDRIFREKEENLREEVYLNRKKMEALKNQLASANCVKQILEQMAQKAGYIFYAAVIRSILYNPDNPLEYLRQTEKLIGRPDTIRKMKFAMIGDRPGNDIAPPLKLLGGRRLLTARLRSGKYSADLGAQGTGRPEEQPMFDVATLAHVKAHLLQKENWNRVECIFAPRFFDRKIVFRDDQGSDDSRKPRYERRKTSREVLFDDVLHGIEMNPHMVTSRVCTGVMIEFIQNADAEDAERCIEEIVTRENMNCKMKALVLARLVNWDQALCPSLLSKAESIQKVFDADELTRQPLAQTERNEIAKANDLLKSKECVPS